jgi:hypothetical protein
MQPGAVDRHVEAMTRDAGSECRGKLHRADRQGFAGDDERDLSGEQLARAPGGGGDRGPSDPRSDRAHRKCHDGSGRPGEHRL